MGGEAIKRVVSVVVQKGYRVTPNKAVKYTAQHNG